MYDRTDIPEGCDHSNYDDYFDVCEECGMSQAEELYLRAEELRDQLREEGIAC